MKAVREIAQDADKRSTFLNALADRREEKRSLPGDIARANHFRPNNFREPR